jgi:transposase
LRDSQGINDPGCSASRRSVAVSAGGSSFLSLLPRPRNSPLRRGTSIREFEAEFPDEEACLRFLFEKRFGADLPCPRCRTTTEWVQRPARKACQSACCGSWVHPLRGTVFHASRKIGLKGWFRAILFAANATGTPTASFLRRYFDLSHKAAFRMATRLRLQMALQELPRIVGEAEGHVHLAEFRVNRIRRMVPSDAKRKLVLIVSDGRHTAFAIPRNSRPEEVFRAIRPKIPSNATIHCADEALYRKLRRYRQQWYRIVLAGPDARLAEIRSEISILVAKRVIGRLYKHVIAPNLWAYLNEQGFRLNAPHDRSLFWTTLEQFPELRIASSAREA